MAEAVRAQNQDEALVTARKRQIFLAACRVLSRKSFHEATVKEMAREAGLAAGSIYVYLQGKDEILLLLAESMVAELVEMLPDLHLHADGDPRRELLGIMHAALDVIDRYQDAFAVINHEVRYLARRPRYRAALSQVLAGYRLALKDVLERGRALGVIHFSDLPSALEAIHMLCSGWAMGGELFAKTDKETYWGEIAAMVEGRFFGRARDREEPSNSSSRQPAREL
ncbi:MAG: TetR/AcrR family transcriptional regulator [Candidatus Binataceae bacterium]